MNNSQAKVITVITVIGVIAFVVAYTYYLDRVHARFQCQNVRKITCSDEWRCENNTSDYNVCYQNATAPSGLASCLTGVDSAQAQFCPDGDCGCIYNYAQTDNCYAGCAVNLNVVSGSSACCCTEGSECTPC